MASIARSTAAAVVVAQVLGCTSAAQVLGCTSAAQVPGPRGRKRTADVSAGAAAVPLP